MKLGPRRAKVGKPSKFTRDALLRRALLLPDNPTFGKIRLRPFTLWTLDLCDELGLDFFVKRSEGEPSTDDRMFQICALLWFHDCAVEEDGLDGCLMNGSWRAEVEAYQRNVDLAEHFSDLMDYISFFSQLVHAASVRVKKRPKKAGEKIEKEPSAVIEPGNTFALIWTLTGGQLQSCEQEHFLYRQLPLPRLLQYYHCALREALVWTVPTKRKADGKQLQAAKLARKKMAKASQDLAAVTDFL
ncbi:MAG: hypothetical protein QM496_13945 [Verrucomicrobiota bacterium]